MSIHSESKKEDDATNSSTASAGTGSANKSSKIIWTFRILLMLVGLRLVHLLATRYGMHENLQGLLEMATTKAKDSSLRSATTMKTVVNSNSARSSICTLFPTNNHSDPAHVQQTECFRLLQKRLGFSREPTSQLQMHRWLFFGDSTMGYLFTKSPLHKLLLREEPITLADGSHRTSGTNLSTILNCSTILQETCHLNEQFGLPPLRYNEWILPNVSKGEGPVIKSHNCRGCSSCKTHYTKCIPTSFRYSSQKEHYNNTRTRQRRHRTMQSQQQPSSVSPTIYGGYFAIEFARDVEVQSLPNYPTTQQALVKLLEETYNSLSPSNNDSAVKIRKPICVVNAGIHDMHIPNITLPLFVENVQWYVSLLLKACHHVIWLPMNCPKLMNDTDPILDTARAKHNWPRWPQTRDRVREWNDAANLALQQLMNHESQAAAMNRITIVDIFDASVARVRSFLEGLTPAQKQQLTDNVHMNMAWYWDLGNWFHQVIQILAQQQYEPL